MSFSQALSGLRAQAENIKVVSNNIANSQTVGFKTGNILFADVFAGAGNVGLGVNVVGVMQDFRSGDLENTGRALDLAIAGNGFYRLEKPNGEVVYSRNGEFNQDRDGFLVNSTGQFLTGYGLSDANDPFSEVIAGGAPQRLQIPPDDMPAQATGVDGGASVLYNLDASVVPDEGTQKATVFIDYGTPANPGDPDADPQVAPTPAVPPAELEIDFHFSSSYTVYDSLGNARTVTTYFEKTGDNTWTSTMTLDGVRPVGVTPGTPAVPAIPGDPDADPPVPDTPATPATPATSVPDFVLNFDANGQLDSISDNDGFATGIDEESVTLTFLEADFEGLGGAGNLVFNLDFEGTTQFNNNSVMNLFQQDGYTSGTLVGIEVQKDGTVTRIFTNERREAAGQIVLTNFINPEGLRPDGQNAWRQTNDSGEPILGTAQTGIFGSIEGGVLENSNVDLAQELVNMIIAQRAYQANSSSIGTQDEMLQTVINL